MTTMKTITVTELKAQALRVVHDVHASGQTIVVTRYGKPVAEIAPYRESPDLSIPGRLSHTLIHEGDIVTPLGASTWESAHEVSS
jgi:prevent-host-death family protein